MPVALKALAGYTNVSYFRVAFQHDIDQNISIGKRCLQYCMLFFSGIRHSLAVQFVSLVTMTPLLMQSINIPSRAQQFVLFKTYSLLPQCLISICSPFGFLRKRTLLPMQHPVMIIESLLTWAFRYPSNLQRKTCAASSLPYSQIARRYDQT